MSIINRRLNLCADIEEETVLIYRTFAMLFPDGKDVFKGLFVSEQNHGRLIERAKISHKRKVLPPEFLPHSTLELEHTLHHLRRTAKLASDGMGLREACYSALAFEDLIGEKYLQEVVRGEIEMELDKELAELLETLSKGEKAHAEIIRHFMASQNLITPE